MTRFFFFLILAVTAAIDLVGQVNPAQRFYDYHRHELVGPRDLAVSGKLSLAAAGADDADYFVLQLSSHYLRPGDKLVAKLIPIKSHEGAIDVAGRHTDNYFDNPDGSPDRAEGKFFTPTICGNRGFCPEARGPQVFEVYSAEITELDNSGEHALDFVIYDQKTGKLLQQVFAYYYVNNSNSFGRIPFRLEKAEIAKISDNIATVIVYGNFPKDGQLAFHAGSPGFAVAGPVSSKDGITISFQISLLARKEVPIDITVLWPGFRSSWTLRSGVILPMSSPAN
jgi:hypothetical protein